LMLSEEELEPIDKLKEALRNCREKNFRWQQIIEYLTFIVESEFTSVTTGSYLSVIRTICKNKEAKTRLLGYSPYNLAVVFYILYARKKDVSITKVVKTFKRRRNKIYELIKIVRESHRIALGRY